MKAETDLNMQAYYYEFEPTGNRAIDLILCAVATAGQSFHNTDCWNEKTGGSAILKGETPVEWIQNAANAAAQAAQTKPTRTAQAGATTCPRCGEEFRLVWIGFDPPEPYGEVCGCPEALGQLADARDDKRADDAEARRALQPQDTTHDD